MYLWDLPVRKESDGEVGSHHNCTVGIARVADEVVEVVLRERA